MWTKDDFTAAFEHERRFLRITARRILRCHLWADIDDIISEVFESAWRHRDRIEHLPRYLHGAMERAAVAHAVSQKNLAMSSYVSGIRNHVKDRIDRMSDYRTPESLLLERNPYEDVWRELARKLTAEDRKKLAYWQARNFQPQNEKETARLVSLRKRIQAAIAKEKTMTFVWPDINPYPLGAVGTTPGTPVSIMSGMTPGTTLQNTKAKRVSVFAPTTNVGNIYIGRSSMVRATFAGVLLQIPPGQQRELLYNDVTENQIDLTVFFYDQDHAGDVGVVSILTQ